MKKGDLGIYEEIFSALQTLKILGPWELKTADLNLCIYLDPSQTVPDWYAFDSMKLNSFRKSKTCPKRIYCTAVVFPAWV